MRDGRPQLLSGGTGDSPQINDARQITDFVSSEQGVTRGPWSRDRLLLWAPAATPTAPSTRPGPTTLATNGWNPDGSQILLPDGWSQRAGTPAAALVVVSRSQRQTGCGGTARPGAVPGHAAGRALRECSWIRPPAAGTSPALRHEAALAAWTGASGGAGCSLHAQAVLPLFSLADAAVSRRRPACWS